MGRTLETSHPDALEELVQRELSMLLAVLCEDLGVFAQTFLRNSKVPELFESALRRAFVHGETCEGVQRGVDAMNASNNMYRAIFAGSALGSGDPGRIEDTRKLLKVD